MIARTGERREIVHRQDMAGSRPHHRLDERRGVQDLEPERGRRDRQHGLLKDEPCRARPECERTNREALRQRALELIPVLPIDEEGVRAPAIDAGDNPLNLATDQRGDGFARTYGSAPDIGAFEAQPAAPLDRVFANGFDP